MRKLQYKVFGITLHMGCTDKFYRKGEQEVMSSSDDQGRPQKMAVELGLED